MQERTNPLLCNPESGICEIPSIKSDSNRVDAGKAVNKPIKIMYYTDPICSSCWGIEPQLRKLELEYGDSIEIEYRMGGLLKDWSYNSGGISKPSDVAHHWDEVSVYYDMPIDGDIWLEDPLPSSYPPSIAFKAAQMQDQGKAILFLREIREMVFMKKQNITKWEYLESAAKKAGLNIVQFSADYEGKAKELFLEDLKMAGELGVRGFPTLLFTNSTGQKEIVYGSRPYIHFESALLKLCRSVTKNSYDKNWEAIFSAYHSLTAKEFSELTGKSKDEAVKALEDLGTKGYLTKYTTKNGSLWTVKVASS